MELDAINDRIKALSMKEKAGILLAVCVVIYGIWDFTFMQPMQKKEALLNSSLDEKSQQMMALTEQVQNLVNSDQSQQYKQKRQRLESVISQLKVTDQKLLEITSSLIAPDQMAKVLETLLVQSKGLEIRRLKSLGAKPFPERNEKPDQEQIEDSMVTDVNKKVADEEIKIEIPTAWEHGLRLEFSGSYLDTMKYLKSLEDLDWKFYWDSIEMDVAKYPNINTAIEVYTLSLDKEWIDI